MTRDVTFALAGAGARGALFAEWLAENVGVGAIKAVADPDPVRRNLVADLHGVPIARRFEAWQEMLDEPRLADILINTTMDRQHADSAVKGMEAGYHMLLEKPMAVSFEDCVRINRTRQQTKRFVSVCHSLRYHSVFTEVRRIIRSGAIGEVVSLDLLEAVELVHYSHSYVRGNWGIEEDSTFMLMAKSCHDIDILSDLAGTDCLRAQSFGSLSYFKKENQPVGAPEYCASGCPVEANCPHCSLTIYGPDNEWSRIAGLYGLDEKERHLRLLHDRYGRCVFHAKNNVVDHQVVTMEFEDGVTATFTMTGFTPRSGRYLRVHGTRGYVEAKTDQRTVDLYEFWEQNRHSHIQLPEQEGSHGGGDAEVIKSLIAAVENGDESLILTTTAESLKSHSIVFAAERSRREGRTVALTEFEMEGLAR